MIAKRGKEGGIDAGNNLRRVLRLVFTFAVEHNMRSDDPTTGVPSLVRPRAETGDGFRTWTENDIATFIAKHPLGTRALLALCLLLYRGNGVGPKSVKGRYDPKDFTGRKITLTQQKTGKADASDTPYACCSRSGEYPARRAGLHAHTARRTPPRGLLTTLRPAFARRHQGSSYAARITQGRSA